jgi:hypothetical protein
MKGAFGQYFKVTQHSELYTSIVKYYEYKCEQVCQSYANNISVLCRLCSWRSDSSQLEVLKCNFWHWSLDFLHVNSLSQWPVFVLHDDSVKKLVSFPLLLNQC